MTVRPNDKSIRNIDPDLYLAFKARAVREGRTIGDLLQRIMKTYLRRVGELPKGER